MGPLTLRRFDTETRQAALDVDATDLVDSDAVSLYAEGVS